MTNKKGFTLVEVVVSLLIILAAVSGIFASFVASQKYIGRAKRRAIAINSLRQQIEQLKPAVRQDTWKLSTNPLYTTAGITTTYTATSQSIKSLKNGQIIYSVTSAADTALTSYRTVAITAKWDEAK